MSARDALTVVVLRNNGEERLMLARSPDTLKLEPADMIPNPVQRRRAEPRPSDDLIAPCAQEGGTFRDPAPAREPIPEYSLPSWACALIILATCGFCMWWGA